MAVVNIAGILKNPDNGVPAKGAKIEFRTVQNNDLVLIGSFSSVTTTDDTGAYSIDVNYGLYSVWITYQRDSDSTTPSRNVNVAPRLYLSSAISDGDLNDVILQYINWSDNENFRGEWLSSYSYSQNDTVVRGGDLYYSLTNTNTNNDPLSSPANWASVEFPASGTPEFIPKWKTAGVIEDSFYTEDSLILPTEAEFFALVEQRKNERAGSGYDGSKVNFVYNADGSITIPDQELCMNGFKVFFKSKTVNAPEAQSDENARQDLFGLELFIEKLSDKDFYFPYGDIQGQLANDPETGEVLQSAGFSGSDTYSLYGNHQSAGDVVGTGSIFSDITIENKAKIFSNFKNNCFLGDDGFIYQVRYRLRIVKGETSNGAEWFSFGWNADYPLRYNISTESYVKPKGKLISITSEFGNYNSNESGFYDGHLAPSIFLALNSSSSTATEVSYKGQCYFISIIMMPRNRNQGAFHPTYNKNGTKKFSDGFWYETALSITSTADCFVSGNLLTASGYVSSGVSGRPDGLYYDEINERDVRDLRLPTFYEEVTSARCNTEINKCFSNQNRGYEAEFEITYVNPVSATLDVKTTTNNYGTTNTRLAFDNEKILNDGNKTLGSYNILSKNFIGFIKGNSGAYYLLSSIYDYVDSDIDIHPRHGDVTADFTVGNQYSVIVAQRTDSFSNNKITRCEIIGDPANYNFDTHVGVPNLIDVNDLSSNLPADKTTGENISHCKSWFLTKKIQSSGINVYIDGNLCSSVDTTTVSNTQLTFYISFTLSRLIINFTDTYATLGYASESDMADNCVIEVYYEGYANEFESSVNEEVENRIFSDIVALNSNVVNYGALTYNELFGRIQTNSTAPYYSQLKANNVILDSTNKITNLSHDAFTLSNASGFKAFSGITNKDGLLYPVIFSQETIFDLDQGDNSSFEIEDYAITDTDDNTNVIVKVTAISKNPIGFTKE